MAMYGTLVNVSNKKQPHVVIDAHGIAAPALSG
jgi:hypothetical protein